MVFDKLTDCKLHTSNLSANAHYFYDCALCSKTNKIICNKIGLIHLLKKMNDILIFLTQNLERFINGKFGGKL